MAPATDGLASSQRPVMRRLGRARVRQGLGGTTRRTQLVATGTGKAVRAAAVPARAGLDDTERRVLRGAPAEARGPRVRRLAARQALHWGQASSARRAGRTVEQAVPEETFTLERSLWDGGGSHRRSRSGDTVALTGRRDENAGDARTPAREAARGERTVAPCPRGAVHRATKTPAADAHRRGVQPVGC